MEKKSVLLFLVLTLPVFGGNYEYLKKFESDFKWPIPEKATVQSTLEASPEIHLGDYYSEFQQDHIVTVYVGGGAEFFQIEHSPRNIFDQVSSLNENEKLGLTNLKFDSNKWISFYDPKRQLTFKITVGGERNEFIEALANYEVIVYMGHARYGRGPAFEQMWNYFRMGYEFPTIELDVRNKYFFGEPLLNLVEYPAQNITLGNEQFQYQYRGQKVESSYLPTDSYTKVIEGNAKDLMGASYLEGKQIFLWHSCSSEPHWRPALRELFSDPKEKLFYGTTHEVGGSYTPTAVLISSLVKQLGTSIALLNELKKVEPKFVAF